MEANSARDRPQYCIERVTIRFMYISTKACAHLYAYAYANSDARLALQFKPQSKVRFEFRNRSAPIVWAPFFSQRNSVGSFARRLGYELVLDPTSPLIYS